MIFNLLCTFVRLRRYELDKIYRCLSELRKDYDKLSEEGKQQLDFLTNYFAILEQNDYDNTRK